MESLMHKQAIINNVSLRLTESRFYLKYTDIKKNSQIQFWLGVLQVAPNLGYNSLPKGRTNYGCAICCRPFLIFAYKDVLYLCHEAKKKASIYTLLANSGFPESITFPD